MMSDEAMAKAWKYLSLAGLFVLLMSVKLLGQKYGRGQRRRRRAAAP
jgi:hypothetical protein